MNFETQIIVIGMFWVAAFILGRIWESGAIYIARKQIRQHLPTSLIKHWSLRAYGEGNLTEEQRDAIWKWLDM